MYRLQLTIGLMLVAGCGGKTDLGEIPRERPPIYVHDSGARDRGVPHFDSGSFDSGPFDSGSFDAGSSDSGSSDSGSFDSGSFDSGSFDSGPFDSGPFDSGPFDSGIGDGAPDAPPSIVKVLLTGDDKWTGYFDGVPIGSNENWRQATEVVLNAAPGHHVLAIRVHDIGGVIAGFLAQVTIDGTVFSLTGDGSWLHQTNPSPGFFVVGLDDSTWQPAKKCPDTSPWGSAPRTLTSVGAEWVYDGNCRGLNAVGFRLHFDIPN